MTKSAEAYRTISEVSRILDVPAHVLRFWESKFPQIKPMKRAGGRRYFRPVDVALLGGIRQLLHEQGLTIRGVQKILKEQGTAPVIALSGLDLGGEAPPPVSPALVYPDQIMVDTPPPPRKPAPAAIRAGGSDWRQRSLFDDSDAASPEVIDPEEAPQDDLAMPPVPVSSVPMPSVPMPEAPVAHQAAPLEDAAAAEEEEVPEAPIELDVPHISDFGDPLLRVVTLLSNGATPYRAPPGEDAEAGAAPPATLALHQVAGMLQGIPAAALSPVERIRLLALRDRLARLRDRLIAPPRAPQG